MTITIRIGRERAGAATEVAEAATIPAASQVINKREKSFH